MNHLPSKYCFLGFSKKQKKRTRSDDDSDSESDNELFFFSKDNWPRFMVVKSASEEQPLSELSPFAVQKGFQAMARTLKSTKWLRDGSFLVECSRKTQAENLLKTVNFLDQPVHVSVHRTLNSSAKKTLTVCNVYLPPSLDVQQWGAADAEIKVPSGYTELKRYPFKACSRSV